MHRSLIRAGLMACTLAVLSPTGATAQQTTHTAATPWTMWDVGDLLVPPAPSACPAAPDGRAIEPEWTYVLNAPVLSGATFADVDGDLVDDVIVSSYDPVNPYQGGQITILDMSGNALPGWPVSTQTGPFPATPAVADVDDDGDIEVVCCSWYAAYIWNHDGTVYPGWPKSIGSYASPALGDLDGDGDLEIAYASTGNRFHVFHHDGTAYSGWPYTAQFGPYDHFHAPSLGNIDGQPGPEIAVGTRQGAFSEDPYFFYVFDQAATVVPGFPAKLRNHKTPTALGDIDGDGFLEIVLADWRANGLDYLHVFDHQGNHEPGWPQQVCCSIRLSTPALGDLDGNGDLEIVIGGASSQGCTGNQLFAYHHDGTPLAGWPVKLDFTGCQINSSPIIADIDGDPNLVEVLVKVQDAFHAVHADGTLVDGFPYYLSDQGATGTHSPTPAVGDLDRDGDVEMVYVSNRGTIAFFDEPLGYTPAMAYWPTYKHDAKNTGLFTPPFLKGDMNCDGLLDFGDINPFVLALTDPNGYQQQYPDCELTNADINEDGKVDFGDINPFVNLLTQP